jgi:ubiquinone/menaquinone biosynthesis C-methylase UbiE
VLAGDVAARELFNRRTLERDAPHLMKRLHAGMRVVDFGCGAGSLTLGLAAMVAPAQVLGIDFQQQAIDRARALADESGVDNVRFDVGNIEDIDLPGARFDVAHFNGVLGYLRDPLAAVKLAFRVLKPGRLIAACEPQKDGDWFGDPCAEAPALFFQMAMHNWRADGGDPCLGRRLATLLREAGFEQIEQQPRYSPALADPKTTASVIVSMLERPDARARVVGRGWMTGATWDRLAEDITTWAAAEDAIAAFAECAATASKPVA